MLKHFALAVLLFAVITTRANTQNTVEKFCQIIIEHKYGFTVRVLVHLSTGTQPELFAFKDSTVLTALQKVETLTTDADVLNYMASLGWKFVTIIGFPNYSEKLYFKKEFDKAELIGQ
jgi:hypothetical protein